MAFNKFYKKLTIEEFIVDQENIHPGATGEFTLLMHEFTDALRMISSEVRRAGINDILGMTSNTNVHGEQVRKIDEYANTVIIEKMQSCGQLCAMISEESEDLIAIPDKFKKGKYILAFDPLDGSTNIDVDITIGTIFSLYIRKNSSSNDTPAMDEVLQPGYKQIAAGYALYGSSTILVYTTGNGVNVFALDPDTGDFLLIFENVIMPDKGHLYSCNEGNFYKWDKWVRDYVTYLKTPGDDKTRPYNFRYVASSVADIHRTLHYGGIYLYPSADDYPNGKIRLLYEANPLAMIVEQAGGSASNGSERILDILPKSIHERTAFFIGSKENVYEAESYFKKS